MRGLKGRKTLNKDPDPINPKEGIKQRSVTSYDLQMEFQNFVFNRINTKAFFFLK